MKVLIIGGPRQGEWLELAAIGGHEQKTYVDLLTAETYRIHRLTWAVEGPVKGVAAELFTLPIAVHPSISGPMEPQLAEMALYQVIAAPHVDAFMREHAVPQPMAEPDLAEVIPDTPAEITESDHG